jgi:hypothetical protein
LTLSGITSIARAMAGTAVLRMVVSSACMKNATATSHGNRRLMASPGGAVLVAAIVSPPA